MKHLQRLATLNWITSAYIKVRPAGFSEIKSQGTQVDKILRLIVSNVFRSAEREV